MAEVMTPEQMDLAAQEAKQDLENLSSEQVEAVAAWWAKWYLKAGHKRLGRVMVRIAKS